MKFLIAFMSGTNILNRSADDIFRFFAEYAQLVSPRHPAEPSEKSPPKSVATAMSILCVERASYLKTLKRFADTSFEELLKKAENDIRRIHFMSEFIEKLNELLIANVDNTKKIEALLGLYVE